MGGDGTKSDNYNKSLKTTEELAIVVQQFFDWQVYGRAGRKLRVSVRGYLGEGGVL